MRFRGTRWRSCSLEPIVTGKEQTMKRVIVYLLGLAGIALVAQADSSGQPADPAKQESKVKLFCPVVGLPDAPCCPCATGYYCSLKPRPGLTADYKGAKVQFCCGGCAKMFKEAPAKFAVTANHQLVATKQAKQEKCPLCGGKTDPDATIDIAGVKVALCSEGCRKKVVDAPAKDRPGMVFGEQPFARGFVVAAAKDK
jgi:hypothetical protein